VVGHMELNNDELHILHVEVHMSAEGEWQLDITNRQKHTQGDYLKWESVYELCMWGLHLV
jgi:hypothetical protein